MEVPAAWLGQGVGGLNSMKAPGTRLRDGVPMPSATLGRSAPSCSRCCLCWVLSKPWDIGKQSQHFSQLFGPLSKKRRVKDKSLRWKVNFPNRLFSAHPGPLMATVPPGKPRSVAGLQSGSAIGIQLQDGRREGCRREEEGEDIVPRREMLQGGSRGTERTHLPVRRQLPRQQFLAALPGCEAGHGPGGLACVSRCLALRGDKASGRAGGTVGTSHSIPSGGSAWQRCFACRHPAGQVPLQHGLAAIPAMGHPPLPRGPAGSGGAAARAGCPELLGEAGLLPRLPPIALGRRMARPQSTLGGIRFYKGDANHSGTLGLWSPCPWHCPRGWEKGPVAQQYLGWSIIASRTPCPDPNQLPELQLSPCSLPIWGRAGGRSTVVGNLEADRQTLVQGWDGKWSVPYWHSWRWQRSWGREGARAGWSWDVR